MKYVTSFKTFPCAWERCASTPPAPCFVCSKMTCNIIFYVQKEKERKLEGVIWEWEDVMGGFSSPQSPKRSLDCIWLPDCRTWQSPPLLPWDGSKVKTRLRALFISSPDSPGWVVELLKGKDVAMTQGNSHFGSVGRCQAEMGFFFVWTNIRKNHGITVELKENSILSGELRERAVSKIIYRKEKNVLENICLVS